MIPFLARMGIEVVLPMSIHECPTVWASVPGLIIECIPMVVLAGDDPGFERHFLLLIVLVQDDLCPFYTPFRWGSIGGSPSFRLLHPLLRTFEVVYLTLECSIGSITRTGNYQDKNKQ